MTWIDERLFGWSRSAKRGTSAWGGFSGEESRIGTPDESDDEDTGDYDNVVGLIPGHDDLPKSRSRNSSYADLQRLRLAPLSQPPGAQATSIYSMTSSNTSPTTELDGLHFRKSQRTRKASLSDGVPVERLAAVDREEPFVSATDDLNDEMRKQKGKSS